MSRPHWTRLGMPQGRCARKDCLAALPVAPELGAWWTGGPDGDLLCRRCALEAGAPSPEEPDPALLD